jgi:putative sterol carrier protein
MPASVQEAFEQMPARFNASAATGIDAIYQFNISGNSGGMYWIQVANQEMHVYEGENDAPTLVFSASDEDFLKLVNGELSGMSAFMAGKIKVKGDMGMALKLQSLFGIGG